MATSQLAFAGRPLFTDDATVTPAGACQAESWYQYKAHGYELNVFPACNLVGNVEITLGLIRRDAANSYSLQGKKIFREFEPDSGVGAWPSARSIILGRGRKVRPLPTYTLMSH